MKHTNISNYIYAVLFLLACVFFGVMSAPEIGKELKEEVEERKEDAAEIQSYEDVKALVSLSEVNGIITENVAYRYPLIETYGRMNWLLGKNEIGGFKYVRDKDGFLYNGNFWADVYDRDEKALAIDVIKFSEQLEKSGTDFYFVALPQKYDKKTTNGYAGIPYGDYSFEMSQFLLQLRKYNVEYLDCTESLKESGLTKEEQFFKTDHHWTSRAAFYCYTELVEQLNDRGYNLDPTGYYRNIDNYTSVVYEDLMLGSAGRSAGISYAGLEDFELLYVEDGTEYDYSRKSNYGKGSYHGTVTESLLAMELPEDIKADSTKIYDESLYDIYLHGVSNEATIINKSNPDGLKVLMLRDSFGDPIASYMAPLCGQIDLIWPKYVSQEKIWEYIDEEDYDLVIVALYPDDMSSDFIHFWREP